MMKASNPETGSLKRVTAVFADRWRSFDLPDEATFEDLVDCLTDLDGAGAGPPLSVNVRFET